jgi:ketosteroid isomerase-like protein
MLLSQATGAASEQSSAAADAQAVETWLSSYSISINRGDPEALGRLWADGADWAPPDAPLVSGRDAILRLARDTFGKYTVSHRFTAQAFKVVEGFGVAIIAGAERYTPKTSTEVAWGQNVKGVVILRRDEDGLWRGTHFIWNRDAPANH